MLVPLAEAAAETCGGKAAALGALIRAGLPVPAGFVVPFPAYDALVRGLDPREAITARPIPAVLVAALQSELEALGDLPVAVRSSAANEDTAAASAAGQHDSFLGVHGVAAVADAVRACWASLWSHRATSYRDTSGSVDEPAMAVIVQRHVDAEAAGVMFTPDGASGATVIEAAWGLGPGVVEGRVAPDTYRVAADGSVGRTIADKRTRLDRNGSQIVARDVPADCRGRATIGDATAARLARLGQEIAAMLGGPQDIEWAITGGQLWILQARPVTAGLPPAATTRLEPSADDRRRAKLIGTPASRGTASGPARIVHGPGDFRRVQPGDILVCRFTEPAWTPLLRIAAGVVTETGGILSHAAIIAREHTIPAVVGVPNAMTHLTDGIPITIEGTTGTIRLA